MMRRRFRRGRRAAWSYADAGTLQIVGTGSLAFSYFWLLPPARVNFLLNTGPRPRDSLTYAGSHLWLDFYWENMDGSAQNLPDVDFAVMKTIQLDDDTPDLTPFENQWTQPATPAALTSWNEDDDDGTFGFLWQHHIKGLSPANSIVATFNYDGTSGATRSASNQSNLMKPASTDNPGYMCRKVLVTQEWQPDVVIRSKRRLRKSEGICLVMSANIGSSAMHATCNVHMRTLTK